ncbi:hypothetical protein D3C79_645010 [compost metagenome]
MLQGTLDRGRMLADLLWMLLLPVLAHQGQQPRRQQGQLADGRRLVTLVGTQ